MEKIVPYILTALAVLITLTVHEFSHGYVAYLLGDDTAKNRGRLTFNPLAHIDPFGAICMILFKFGWAKPVPINPRNFKNPRLGFAISSLAGPISNLLCALLGAGAYLVLFKVLSTLSVSGFLLSLLINLLNFIYIFHFVNIGIAVFNLIPVPPLDGSRVLTAVLPTRLYFKIMRYERMTYFILIGWLLLGDIFKNALLSVPLIAKTPILNALAGVLSLSDIIGLVIEKISDGMIGLLTLFPFL